MLEENVRSKDYKITRNLGISQTRTQSLFGVWDWGLGWGARGVYSLPMRPRERLNLISNLPSPQKNT